MKLSHYLIWKIVIFSQKLFLKYIFKKFNAFSVKLIEFFFLKKLICVKILGKNRMKFKYFHLDKIWKIW
jgi:hypothetical protein